MENIFWWLNISKLSLFANFFSDYGKQRTSISQPAFTCSKVTMETPEWCVKSVQSLRRRHQRRLFNVFIVSFDQNLHIFWVFPLLTSNKQMRVWWSISGKYHPAGNYMFKVNNRKTRTRWEICSKLTIKTPGVVLVSLLLTLNIFHTLF